MTAQEYLQELYNGVSVAALHAVSQSRTEEAADAMSAAREQLQKYNGASEMMKLLSPAVQEVPNV